MQRKNKVGLRLMVNKKIIFIIILLGLGGIFMSTDKITRHASSQETIFKKPVRILLLGASVGNAWNLPEWPERMNSDKYAFEMIAYYEFDKSNAFEEIIMRPKRKFHLTRTYLRSLFKQAPQKPEIIIIKECAAYFPGDLDTYKTLIDKWVKRCLSVGIKPVLATVVPVTEEHAQRKPGRLEGILNYNDWIRSYAHQQNIGLLDLEANVRISDENRSLRPEFTKGDGLHLNRNAYDILDKLLVAFFENKT